MSGRDRRGAALAWAVVFLSASVGGLLGCGSGATGASSSVESTSSLPKVPTSEDLRGIWGSSTSDVWAVGDNGTIVHYNGHAWAVVPSGTTEYLNGVYGTGPKDAWIVSGSGTVLRWDGTAWTTVTRIDGAQLLSVWVAGPTDVWAVGIDAYAGSSGLVTHWDGTTWSTADVPGSTSLWGAWGSGQGDVWLVGEANQVQGLVLRGDGTAANPFDSVGFDGGPGRSIYGTGPNDVWVAPYQGAIEHWNGSSWTKASMAAPQGPLLGIASSGTDEVWAVGLNGVAAHDHAGTWSATMTGSTAVLWGVWTSARDDVWVAGGSATVLRWNGSAWRP